MRPTSQYYSIKYPVLQYVLLQYKYLLQDGADAAHLTVDEEAFLLAPVHLLDDAPVLHGVGHVADGARRHLPVASHRRLHDGLQDVEA